jgi:hypothetical protein
MPIGDQAVSVATRSTLGRKVPLGNFGQCATAALVLLAVAATGNLQFADSS